jgi:hypothetical protein
MIKFQKFMNWLWLGVSIGVLIWAIITYINQGMDDALYMFVFSIVFFLYFLVRRFSMKKLEKLNK